MAIETAVAATRDELTGLGALLSQSDRLSPHKACDKACDLFFAGVSLADAGVEPSVGSVGDSYDNALAETINGLYKTRGDLAATTVAQPRTGGVRHARMG